MQDLMPILRWLINTYCQFVWVNFDTMCVKCCIKVTVFTMSFITIFLRGQYTDQLGSNHLFP